MTVALLSILFVVLVWWAATAAIFWLDRRSRTLSLAAATLALIASLVGLALTSAHATPAGAFAAFACAIGVWGWNEVLFLSGVVTGPNRRPAESGLTGWARFTAAAGSVMHHEFVLLASAAAVVALTATAENHVALCAFMTLWAMRLSAKLNIFVGVPNPGEGLLPERLRYLAGHFRKRPVGPFFALTFSAATLALFGFVAFGAGEEPSDFEIASVALVSTLLALAVIEHVFLALPFDSGALFGRAGHADDTRPAPPRAERRRARAALRA